MSDVVDVPPPTPAMPILRKTARLLPCELTDFEMRGMGRALAACCRELVNHEATADSIKKELKATEARLEAQRSELTEVISRGTEMREVPIHVLADYEAGMAREIRLDTGEVLLSRPLEPKERQQAMFPDPDPFLAPDGRGLDDGPLIDNPDADGPVNAAEAATRARSRGRSTRVEPPPPDE